MHCKKKVISLLPFTMHCKKKVISLLTSKMHCKIKVISLLTFKFFLRDFIFPKKKLYMKNFRNVLQKKGHLLTYFQNALQEKNIIPMYASITYLWIHSLEPLELFPQKVHVRVVSRRLVLLVAGGLGVGSEHRLEVVHVRVFGHLRRVDVQPPSRMPRY